MGGNYFGWGAHGPKWSKMKQRKEYMLNKSMGQFATTALFIFICVDNGSWLHTQIIKQVFYKE